ncbi:MAG: Na+/galactose cotransporter, partial [Acidobacteriota bacterium]
WSWIVCVAVTVAVSYMTKPKPETELVGLVYGCTQIPSEGHLAFYQRPAFWAAVVGVVFIIFNILVW